MREIDSFRSPGTPAKTGRACFLRALILAAAFWLAPWPLHSAEEFSRDEGQPFVRTFLPRDYHAYGQCWGITQDARGVMYIGNEGYVLEYDGATWRKIVVTEIQSVFTLAFDPATDRVYLGTTNDLGYLELTPGGERKFVSMLPQLPADARDVGNVRAAYITPQGIYFCCDAEILLCRDGHFKVWKNLGTSSLQSGWVAGSLYIQSSKIGLQRLENDAFVPASADPIFKKTLVLAMTTGPGGSLLTGTLNQGLFIVRNGTPTPFSPECQEYLKASGIIRLRTLRDGSLAVGTLKGGVVILDTDGRYRSCLDASGGLPPGGIAGMGEDAEGGLWLGTNAGVMRAEVNTPFSLLRTNDPRAVQPEFRAAASFQDKTYLASTSGLFRLVPANPSLGSGAHLEAVPGADNSFYGVCGVENGILGTGMEGTFFIGSDGHPTPVTSDRTVPVFSLCPSRLVPGRMYVGGQGNLHEQRFDPKAGRWVETGILAELGGSDDPVDSIHNTGQDDLWLTTIGSGVYRVKFSADAKPSVVSFFKEPGPLKGEDWTSIGSAPGSPLLVATRRRLYRFDEATRNFLPAGEYGARFVDGSFTFDTAEQTDDESLWFAGHSHDDPSGEQIYGRAKPSRKNEAAVFHRLPHKISNEIGVIENFLPVKGPAGSAGGMFAIGSYGIARVDLGRWAEPGSKGFSTLIRRVTSIGHGETGGPEPLLTDRLPYARNSVHFEFAANTYAVGAALRYQTRLSGSGQENWSDFEERTSLDYSDLREGNYVFEVRARDADGRMGNPASLAFHILPPWQRTPWAYALYGLALALAVAALVRWRGQQLRQRNAALEVLVGTRTGELRGREAELVRARDAADTANRAKSAFLANMTHELRTPLNAILGYSQILLKDRELSTRNRERITTMDRSGHHLLTMINEVLDLSKIEAGKLTLLVTPFSLKALLDDLCAAFQPRFAEKGLAFECIHAPGLPAVINTDAGKLRQVLFNLLGNALKFTQLGSVRLETGAGEGGKLRFSVVDTGVGIAADELRHIFLAFHQAGDSETATQGTGLGLSISQRLVELLGGHLQVESTPGQGSRFSFELDLPPVAAAGDLLNSNLAGDAHRRVVGFRGPVRRLLIVDDEAVNRNVLGELLAPLGFDVDEAASGEECLRRCGERPPDALLLDLRMRPMGGLEVARTLRSQGGPGAAIRIVAVSASVFAADRQQAIDAGCDDFLPKPFKEEQLLAVLGRLLQIEWVRAEAPVDPVAPTSVADPARLEAEIDALLELARSGDILGLKARFGVLRDTGGIPEKHLPLVRRLEPLLASYEIDRVHDVLREFQRDASS